MKIKFNIAFLGILLSLFSFAQHDHEGHTHSHDAGTESALVDEEKLLPSISENASLKYEVLLKFEPVEPGEELEMILFLSDVDTNVPIDSAAVLITNVQVPNQSFEAEVEDKGIYHVHTIMGEEKTFDLNVQIQVGQYSEVIQLHDVDFQHHHTALAEAHVHESHLVLYTVIAIALLLLGVFIGRYIGRSAVRRNTMLLLVLLCIIPTTQWKNLSAHEGEHGPEKKEEAHLSSEFLVKKESQFLMDIRTQRMGDGQFTNSRRLYGTIIPASNGQTIVSSPQAGRIASIQVAVGEKVSKGQLIAVVERISDAGSDVNFISEKNKAEVEYEAALKEYNRIKSLEGLTSKKQQEEAQARLDIAKANKELYFNGTARNIQLKAPISGIVGPFTLSQGTSINAEQILFTITDINRVYVEAQAYEMDMKVIEHATTFSVQCMEGNHSSALVSLLSPGQEFNASNQSQRVLFSIDNINNEFKIGEFVNVYAYSNESEKTLALPNSAITELEGRPVVFVKNAAERFELRYVATGNDNGKETVITSGIHAGERIVVNGAYQVKLIYMNQ